MLDLTRTAAEIFDPVGPGGVPNKPNLAHTEVWGTQIETAVNELFETGSLGGLGYETRAGLYADLAHPAGRLGYVFGDSTSGYNGTYKKSGASGSGSWSRIGDLPAGGLPAIQAEVDDLEKKIVARVTYADNTAFLAGTTSGDYGYVGTTLKKNVAGVATTVTSDEMTALKTSIETVASRPIIPLTSVGGTTTAYTASSAVAGDPADGSWFVFTPNATNTGSNPTLAINGGTARTLVLAGGTVVAGQLVSGVRYMLHRVGSGYVVHPANIGVTVGTCEAVSSNGVAYTATVTAVPIMSQRTILKFTPDKTNTGSPTLAINGGSAISILTEDAKAIPAGKLKSGSYYLLWNLTGVAYIAFGVDDIIRETEGAIDASETHRREAAREKTLTTGGSDSLPIYVLPSADLDRWIVSEGDAGRIVHVAGTDVVVDLQFVRPGSGTPIYVYVADSSSAKLQQGPGRKTLTAGANTLVQIIRPQDDHYICTALSGSLTEGADVNDAAAARDRSFITAGQSHAAGFIQGGGLHGLQLGLRDIGFTPSLWPIQGATGGSGLTAESNAVEYWWDPATLTPGPSALTWKAALNGRPAAQPAPTAIYWCFGQTDAAQMGALTEFSIANYAQNLRDLFAWMRDEIEDDGGAANCPIIITPVGSQDAIVPTAAQYSAVRWVELALIAEDAYIFQGPSTYDLPRRYYDSHPTLEGQKLQGYRLATTLNTIWNSGTVKPGPVVTQVQELDSGARYRIHIDISRTANPFTKYENVYGFAILAAGATPLTGSPLPIKRKAWALVGGTTWCLDLYLDVASVGATVMYPWGSFYESATGRFVRDIVYTEQGNFQPLREFVGSNGTPPVAPTV